MPRGSFHAILDYVRRIARPPTGASDEGDAQLLRLFTAGDEAAFAALVRRHGPMVWGVCTRALSVAQDAEDAFQATFLVLVRKARSVAQPELLGPWLYGVALRTALKARAEAARRRVREKAVMEHPAIETSDILQRDLRKVLDEEVSRLPVHYRTPFLLCCLEGLTNEEAAQRLGCPKGTILSRLSRAREMLRGRLSRRGIDLSGAALAALLSENFSTAAVPPALIESTIQLSLSFAAGSAVTALSAQAAVLAEGVLKAMFVTKLKFAVVVMLTLGVVGSGVGFLAQGTGQGQSAAVAQEPPKLAPDKDVKKQPPPASDNKEEAPRIVSMDERGRELRDRLAGPADYQGCDTPDITLAEFLDQFAKVYSLSFTLNEKAFADHGMDNVLTSNLTGKKPIPRMNTRLSTALRVLLDRVSVPTTYLIRKDSIEITTVAAVRAELGLRDDCPLPPLVWEEFDDISLEKALRTLAKSSESSGLNVILDPSALSAEKSKILVKAHFSNVPVDTAARILANMADLQAVRLDNVIYITTPKRATQLQAETKPPPEEAAPPRSPRQFGQRAPGGA